MIATIIERLDPHCVGWIRATASLWGVARDHDLDEPVQLSEEVPVRLRFVGQPHKLTFDLVADRDLCFKTTRAGTHIALRICFRNGSFHEVDIGNINTVNSGETASVKLQPRYEPYQPLVEGS